MTKLSSKDRKALLSNFKQVKNNFSDEEALIELLKRGIPTDNFLVLQRLRRLDIDKISDFDLIMLCGAFDFAITPGTYPYSSKQIQSLNNLTDAIFDTRISNKKK